MNHRNLLRCLLSTGYLSMMLWILLLTVLFAFRRPEPWRTTAASMAFLAMVAVLFSMVGNRGLIRNSIYSANFVAPPLEPSLHLEFDLTSDSTSNTQLFWDVGTGISESQSVRRNLEPHTGLQTVRFPLPKRPIKSLRFDPREAQGVLRIHGIRIVDSGDLTRAVLPLDSLVAENAISSLVVDDDWLEVKIPANAVDPILLFKPMVVEQISRATGTAVADQINP
jgi:hypothetical protein